MGTSLEVAKHRLFDKEQLNVADVKLSLGSSRDATPQDIASEILKGIAQIEAGDYEVASFDDDGDCHK